MIKTRKKKKLTAKLVDELKEAFNQNEPEKSGSQQHNNYDCFWRKKTKTQYALKTGISLLILASIKRFGTSPFSFFNSAPKEFCFYAVLTEIDMGKEHVFLVKSMHLTLIYRINF